MSSPPPPIPDPNDFSYAEQYWFCQLDPYYTTQPIFDIWGTYLPLAVANYDVLRDYAPDGTPLTPQTYAQIITTYDPDPADSTVEASYSRFLYSYDIVSITRIDELGNTWPIVTTPIHIRSAEMRFIDVEVPLDIKFHYQIYTSKDPNLKLDTDWCFVPSTAWAPDYGQICVPSLLSDPLLIARAVWVGLQSIDTLNWPGRRTLYDIISASYPLAQSDVRQQYRTQIRLITFTLDERKQLLTVISAGRVLLFRIPDKSYPESFIYISVGDVTEERIITDHRRPERRWTLEVAIVRRSKGNISFVGGVRTYTTLREFESDGVTPITPRTYNGVYNDYLDYLGAELGLDQAAFDIPVGVPTGRTYGINPTLNAVEITQWQTTP